MIEVTPADHEAARDFLRSDDCPLSIKMVLGAKPDALLALLAGHRQRAERVMRERCAAYVEGKGGVIPGSAMFISLITGDRLPCMSGDGRDKLHPHKRRYFDDATRDLATAIRGIDVKGEGPLHED